MSVSLPYVSLCLVINTESYNTKCIFLFYSWPSLPSIPTPSLLPLAVTSSLSPDSILGIRLDFSHQHSICDKLPFKGPLHY